MRRITGLKDSAIALFCVLLWVAMALGQVAPGQARVQPGTIYICFTSSMNPTVYSSNVFQTAPRTSLGAIAQAWDTHVRQTYHLKPSEYLNSGCSDLTYDPTGQRFIQGLEQAAKTHKSQLVHVDWKYVPGQDTPPPPVVAAERTILYYCSGFLGTTPHALYFSDSFEGPAQVDINLVRDDFVRFIKEKYSPQSHEASGGCGSSDKAKEEAPMRAGGKTIIETGWKPKTIPQALRRGP